jgi:hypothetical protein
MAKNQYTVNPKVRLIFADLEKYRDFCVDYGYKFDESSLYDMRNYTYQQFTKYMSNKNFKDQWLEDERRLSLMPQSAAVAA